MSQHSHKLESFTLHLLAVLLLFSVISSSFLALGVYQNETISQLSKLNVHAAGGGSYTFLQTDFSGGADTSSVYSVPWTTSSDWHKYYSLTNAVAYVDVGTGATRIKSTAPGGEFISSVYDLGTTYPAQYMSAWSDGSTAYFRGADSAGAVTSATWQTGTGSLYSCIGKRYVQFKVTWAGAYDGLTYGSLSSLSMDSPVTQVYGNVKNSSGAALSGASVSVNGTTATTAFNTKNLLVDTVHAGGGYNPNPGDYYILLDYTNNSTTSYQVTASKTGYDSQTKTLNINPSSCTFVVQLDFSLSPPSSSGSTSNSSSGKTTTSKPPPASPVDSSPPVTTSTFQTTKLPAFFTEGTSETTDLSKVTDPTKIKDFKIAVSGKNKIEFSDTLDLSTQNTVDKLKELDKYVKIDKIGVIEVDSKSVPALNKKAKLTMIGLTKFSLPPEILVDGKKDTAGVVTNISFDKKTGILVFNVSHFTTFTAAPKLELISPTTSTIKSLADVVLKARISDPTATVSGTFNGKALASLKPDKTTGEIVISNVTFKTGENILRLTAQSSLGAVVPLVASISYSPDFLSIEGLTQNPLYFTLFLIAALAGVVFALLLGFFVYRKRKREEKITNPTPPVSSS